jgi:predicted nucleic acid-binding Zn ribbon protein
MPLYVYEAINDDGSGGETFELLQPLGADALTHHPDTGVPIRRVFGTPNTPTKWTDSHAKNATTDKSLERTGFTKYVKSDDGKYKKLFGKGPDKLNRPPGQ